MTSRDAILGSVATNRPAGERPLPILPTFHLADGGDRIALFSRNLVAMGGLARPEGTIASLVKEKNAMVVASAVPEYSGNRDLTRITRPAQLADVDLAIVRCRFGVAETGSVLLTGKDLLVNAVAYLAQHLVVLLDPADIVLTLQDAYFRPEFHQADYAVFHTGPSATADIEGVLIHGAQGVRSLTVLIARRQSANV